MHYFIKDNKLHRYPAPKRCGVQFQRKASGIRFRIMLNYASTLCADGRISLTVPAGTQSGQTLRVRGKGMPVTSGRYGDLLVNVRIVVPKHLSAKERHLFEELAKKSRFDPRM